MAQMQCSNCGSYKISTPGTSHGCWGIMFGLPAPLLLGTGVSMIEGGDDMGFVLITIGVVLFAVLFAIFRSRKQYERTHHLCLNCGQIWEIWR